MASNATRPGGRRDVAVGTPMGLVYRRVGMDRSVSAPVPTPVALKVGDFVLADFDGETQGLFQPRLCLGVPAGVGQLGPAVAQEHTFEPPVPDLARQIARGLEAGSLEPTAAAIEPLADTLR